MSRFITLMTLVMLLFTSTASAQTPDQSPESAPDAFVSPLNCLDYQHPGAVVVEMESSVVSSIPGATLTFTGKVKNNNSFPLLAVAVQVKIFRRDAVGVEKGDGNALVDQFVVQKDSLIKAGGELPVTHTWQVPYSAPSGEYYAAYTIVSADRYNLTGLAFSDDIAANQAEFSIKTDAEGTRPVSLSKTDILLNTQNPDLLSFPLYFEAGEDVIVKTTITNPSATEKVVPLQWNQYAWDDLSEGNRRHTKTEVVTLAPNETKSVQYEVQSQREAVVYVTATTQDQDAKSIVTVRYVRDGIEETRISFPGLASFPLPSGTETTLFACAHSTNLPVVSGNILTLSLKDRDGKILHEYRYEGDITGAVSGFGEKFTPEKNINYATLTATLERNGAIVEQVEQVYDCAVLDESTCLPEELSATSLFDFIKTNIITIVLSLVTLLLLIGLLVSYLKKRRQHIDAGPTMTVPMAAVALFFMLPALFLGNPAVGEAKTVQWGSVYLLETDSTSLFRETIDTGVQYQATIVNVATGQPISDGASVAVGTQLRFDTPFQNSQVTWQPASDRMLSVVAEAPDLTRSGYFVNNAAAPATTCATLDHSYTETPWSLSIGHSFYGSGGGDGGVNNTFGATSSVPINYYTPVSIDPPTVTFDYSASSAGLSCVGNICTVTSGGDLRVTVIFEATDGKIHTHSKTREGTGSILAQDAFVWHDEGPCQSDDAITSNPIHNPLSFTVPQQTITFNLSASGSTASCGVWKCDSPQEVGNSCNPAQEGGSCIPGTVENFTGGFYSPNNNRYYPTQLRCNEGNSIACDAIARICEPTSSCPSSVDMPPSTPTIAGPNSGSISTPYTFTYTATDPEGGDIHYGLSDATCTAMYEWFPGSGYVPNGTPQTDSMTWGTAGTYTFYVFAEDTTSGNKSACASHTITIAPAPAATADLKINGSDGPLNVAKNSTLALTWSSANAATCSLYGNGLLGGEVALSGNTTATIAATDDYVLTCGAATDVIRVNVVNQTPLPPTVTYTSGTREVGQTLNFSIQGTDPDGDTIYYEIDWNNDGIADTNTMSVASGIAQPANHSWGTAGSQTFQARTVDSAGAPSAWTTHTETIILAIPSAPTTISATCPVPGTALSVAWSAVSGATSYSYRVDNQANSWQGTCSPTNTGDYCQDSYAGTSVALSGIPGAPFNAWVHACNAAGCSAATAVASPVTCQQYPNFSQPNITYTLSSTFNSTTGLYDFIDVTFQTSNDGGSDTQADAQYEFQFDRGRDGFEVTESDTLGRFTVGESKNRTERVSGGIPFGNSTMRVQIDSTNAVTESNEADNTRVLDIVVSPPDPGLSITADRTQLRNGETTTIRWTSAASYPLTCSVFGPGINQSPSGLSGNATTQAITAKSEYTFSCVEPTTNTTFTDTVTVETQGVIEEV